MIKTDLKRNRQDRLRRGRRSKAGFSLGEMMVAVLIISLLTMCIATGVAFGLNQYNKSVAISEARILSSTLTSVITDELSNTVVYDPGSTIHAVGGKICKGDNSPLIPDAAYEGTQTLSAEIEELEYDSAKERYTVKLTVSPTNTDWGVSNSFDVIPLNPVTVVP